MNSTALAANDLEFERFDHGVDMPPETTLANRLDRIDSTRSLRLLVVSDAWEPQVNGVVRTLRTVTESIIDTGRSVRVVGPAEFFNVPCPTYPEIRLAVSPGARLRRLIDGYRPNALHIATEGPLGLAAKKWARHRNMPFTTAFHTRFPEYVHARFGIPIRWTWKTLRRFHRDSHNIMVATESIEFEVNRNGLNQSWRWPRGVDTTLFRPIPDCGRFADLPRPIYLYVGRVAVEKSIDDFLRLKLPGSKVVVGDGPERRRLQQQFPDAHFAGEQHGEELVRCYSAADCFVFPSKTDTFGLVQIEALACGTPVAAYPVAGPMDILGDRKDIGCLDEDLERAARHAVTCSPDRCREFALGFSWDVSIERFLAGLKICD